MILKRGFRSFVTILTVGLMLLFSTVFNGNMIAQADSEETGINYLALGDSLAAGQDAYGEIGDGYTDFIAEKLGEIGFLQSYSKAFAVPGYTTENVLDDINKNKEVGEEDVITIQGAIENADLITLTIGANDILGKLDRSETGVSIDPAIVPEILEGIGLNLAEILGEITKLNPTAKVFIMGYYNPFPYLPMEQQEPLLPMLDTLNNVILQVANQFQATFVPTADTIALDFLLYLPNPLDVHLSLEGYRVLGDEFLKVIIPTLTSGVENSIYINGSLAVFEQEPMVVEGATLVHVRGIFESLGAEVSWDQEAFSVVIERDTDVIVIDMSNRSATKNGESIELSPLTRFVNERTMLPIRFVEEALGAKVNWDPITMNVFVAD